MDRTSVFYNSINVFIEQINIYTVCWGSQELFLVSRILNKQDAS